MLRLVLFILFIFITSVLLAQENYTKYLNEGIIDSNGHCISSLPGLPRPKGVELIYNNALNYKMHSDLINSNFTSDIERNSKIRLKVKVPIVSKGNFKIISGLRYQRERFHFKNKYHSNSDLYTALNKKTFTTIGSSLYGLVSFKGNKFIFLKSSFKLSGDFKKRNPIDFLRYSFSGVLGVRAKRNFSYGLGLNYSNTFGRQIVLPALSLNVKFNKKLSIDALLPISVKFRYMPNDKNTLLFVTRVNTESYNVSLPTIENNNLFVERFDIITQLIYEREVHDFIWVSASLGNRYNTKYDLSTYNNFIERSSPSIINSLTNALFFELGVFLVPPKKWLKKK